MTKKERSMYVAVIERYKLRHPKEWQDWLELRNTLKSELKDQKFGEVGSEDLRHVGNIPVKLDDLLKTTSRLVSGKPDYLNSEFLKEFKVFRLVDKI